MESEHFYIDQYTVTLLAFFTMMILILLILNIGVKAINLTIATSSKYRVYGTIAKNPILLACDFGSDWAVMTNTYVLDYNSIEYKVVVNNTNFMGTMSSSSYTIKLRSHESNTVSNQTNFLITSQNKILIYRSSSLSSTTRTQNNITDATFASSNAELYWIKNSTK